MKRAVAVAVVAGCSSPARPVVNHVPDPGPPLARARAFELGTNGRRDYRAAAEIYRDACDRGHGDALACGALIRAQLSGRGVAVDRAATTALAGETCLAHRDPFTCVAAAMLTHEERSIKEPLLSAIDAGLAGMKTCDAAHVSACWAILLAGAFDFSDSKSADRRRDERDDEMCRAGIVDGCVANATREHSEFRAVAEQRLVAACDAGDADACAAAPGRTAVPAKDLCAAYDYAACAVAGCQGDAGAAAIAEANHAKAPRPCASYADTETPAHAIATLEAIEAKMCACTDAACAQAVESELDKWAAHLAANPSGKASAAEQAKLDKLAAHVTSCRDRTTTP